MDRDLIRKLQNDAPLTREEQVELELALEEANRSRLRTYVQDLPEEIPSMAWRSGLNEALQNLSQASKPKRRMGWGWLSASALSLAGAGALMFALLKPSNEVLGDKTSVEAALVASHVESVNAIESGAALSPRPTSSDVKGQVAPWNEVDIESL